MAHLTESDVESAALAWLESIGWRIAHGPDIAPDQPLAERRDYFQSDSRPWTASPWWCA